MKLFTVLFSPVILAAAASNAGAAQPETWTVKNVACASGMLATANTLPLGYVVPAAKMRSLDLKNATTFVGEKDATFSVIVNGEASGACPNKSVETILTITFSRNK